MLHKFVVKAVGMAALSAAALTVTSTVASAQANRINFQGTLNISPVPLAANAPDLLIDFLTGTPGTAGQTVAGAPTGTMDVSAGFGAFAGIPIGLNNAVVSDIRINGGTSTVQLNAPAAFLTAGGYSFFATAFDNQTAGAGQVAFGPILLAQLGSNTTGALAVRGFVTGNGLTGTGNLFNGVFTTQFASITPEQLFAVVNGGQPLLNRSVSAEFAVNISSVPEPSTYALMGAGLAGLALVARRRRQTV